MATWTMYMMTSSNTAVSTSGFSIDTDSGAICFGGGDRDTFFNTIQVNTYASSIHVGTVGAQFTNSPTHHASCTGNHLWSVVFANSTDPTKYYGYPSSDGVTLAGPMTMATSGGTHKTDDAFMDGYWVTSPRAYEGLCLHFNHGSGVNVNPITFHYGSGAAVTNPSIAAHLEVVELASSITTSGFASPNPSSKLSLTAHTVNKTDHRWWVALSLKPTAVAFHSSDRIKVEGTYF